jgi:peptidoglycan/xylan/chitin deacetylase (PgdA/CDA1 family)
MQSPQASLFVVMYHYVRDLPNTPWPRIRGVLIDDFREQLKRLQERFEMATLESAVAFLGGHYQPSRPLCLLTFDDGLREHYTEVTPILAYEDVQGVFLLQTSAPLGQVAAVHKNHFLLAALGFEEYQSRFVGCLAAAASATSADVDDAQVRRFYRWDSLDVARFKYLVNFTVTDELRQVILDDLFDEYLGDERDFAKTLYLDWDEACEMQSVGMALGGHSHGHNALPKLPASTRRADLLQCATLIRAHLRPQSLWPFSYPYGDVDAATAAMVGELGFDCAFTTEVGANESDADRFHIRRFDPKDVGSHQATIHKCTS